MNRNKTLTYIQQTRQAIETDKEMTQMLELVDKDYNAFTNMLRKLQKICVIMSKQIGDFCKKEANVF